MPAQAVLPFTISYGSYSAIYNALSFVMASMGASTVYFFFHAAMMPNQGSGRALRTALCITGLVTLIAFYHYFRIFNSWVESYDFGAIDNDSDAYPVLEATGKPFNDAYRYMDWLLTVPLLLIELIMVMSLDEATTNEMCLKLGSAAALMIVLGYPGEITMDHGTRWIFWFLAMLPFIFIVYTLFVGLKDAVEKQPAGARALVSQARYVTIISWSTYPIVYILPMIGMDTGSSALVGIQIGYSISDFISKCGLGLMVTKIAMAKTKESSAGYSPVALDEKDSDM
eukprot:COSAG05_NODE_93_length_19581_cov_53.686685_20_plen_284_part_00